jgi:hypothetical protein
LRGGNYFFKLGFGGIFLFFFLFLLKGHDFFLVSTSSLKGGRLVNVVLLFELLFCIPNCDLHLVIDRRLTFFRWVPCEWWSNGRAT